jgi:curved DNA-binding protein CbpA
LLSRPVKTHYELLGLEPTAEADTIKRAFRREIARYHPDKVVHLGAEFQEMAVTRAAELTVAYKTLTDAALRAEYDASLAAGLPPPHMPAPPPAAAAPSRAAPVDDLKPPSLEDIKTPPPAGGGPGRFASERADRDVILRRAITARVRDTVESIYGKVDTPAVRGFDLAMVPLAKPRFLGAPLPRVLVRIVPSADGAALTDAHGGASRARLQAGKSPVVVLLFSRRIATQQELSKTFQALARQRKAPDAPEEVAVIAVDVSDWSCRLPPNCSAAVRKLADQICL